MPTIKKTDAGRKVAFYGCNRAHGLIQEGRIVEVRAGIAVLKVPFFLEWPACGSKAPSACRPKEGEWDVMLEINSTRIVGIV